MHASTRSLPRDAFFWDGGVASAARHTELDRTQLAQSLERDCALMRAHRYLPSVAVGRYERAELAARVDYCREAEIEIVRRPTGGGAIYLDPGQACWTLTAPRHLWDGSLAELLAALASGQALALREAELDAVYAAPNDIEVNGRKLGSVFATLGPDHLIAQGTLLVELEMRDALSALRVPKEKLSPEGMQSARERFVTLCELGEGTPPPPSRLLKILRRGAELALGTSFRPSLSAHAELTASTPQSSVRANPRKDPPPGARAFIVTPGGVLDAQVRLDSEAASLSGVRISGDLDLQPPELLDDLARSLRGTAIDAIARRVHAVMALKPHELLGFDADDLARVIGLAAQRATQQQAFGLDQAEANTLMVHDPEGAGDARAILEQAEVMLVPYCAKPAWCELRHEDDCTECGLCAVSEAYRLARERNMPTVTIQNFEHLQATLAGLREAGVNAYLGMCCENFYIKRQYAFEQAGMPAILLDIEGATCYDLQQEDLAYKGEFKAEAYLNEEVLEKVMRFVPRLPD